MQNHDELLMNPAVGRQGMNPWPYCQVEMTKTAETASEYEMLYPEVFYMIQPHIIEACDQMEAYGYTSPNKAMVEQMSLGICNDACRMHPELSGYANSLEMAAAASGNPAAAQYRRRRGLFGDLVDILLLTELFGRRRRYYY